MLDDALRLADDEDAYTDELNALARDIVDHIKSHNELMWEPNEVDSRDYSIEYIEENQPRYEYEIYASDDVAMLVDKGVLTAWDLNHYVEDALGWDHVYDGAEVERPWGYDSTTVTVSNLTYDGYEQLNDTVEHHLEGFWWYLVSEHADELDEDEDDSYDEYDDETSEEE